ncbi:glutathione S-transferase family protein [Roseiarcus sp.]|jgi:glutathione S-transferase|uniref:glutathione S-transferase family protein n=1 Tax=Roseiarcus sp. TaxID=1969460 RepID=UPI003D09E159
MEAAPVAEEGGMKLYNSNLAPNPRRVRIFLAEKGVKIPRIEVDLAKLEHKAAEFSALNPFQTIPILELDDGTRIAESIAICRYIEELWPEPNLFGLTALERATIEMWQRQLELRLLLPIAQVLRHSHPHMAEMENPQVPEWAAANRPRALRAMAIVDEALRDRPFIAGDRFTVADITGLVALDFAKPARIAIPQELANLIRWRETLKARPSATA